MKIYLDVCCINRPFDDQKQTRIRLESEAILMILDRIRTSEYTWVTSDVFQAEIERIPDVEKRERVSLIIKESKKILKLQESDLQRATQLEVLGFKGMDALHIACSERDACDVFLTIDDQLIHLASQKENELNIVVMNPLLWLEEVIK